MVRASDHNTDALLSHSGVGFSGSPSCFGSITANQIDLVVDTIEHPEAQLCPAPHAVVAELLLNNLCGSLRSMIIETHSEKILLRARPWIAEGRIDPDHAVVYWIDTKREKPLF